MRCLKIFCLLSLVALIAQPTFAWQRDPDVTRQELNNFDNFLDTHPAIKSDLTKNPALVKDSAYLSAHPELKQFLDTHPGVREEIRENPSGFMKTERHFEKSGKDISATEVKNFDDFLDKHPALEKELQKNPKLVNDPAFVNSHPELKAFLNSHPAIKADLAEHPRRFMHDEKKFDKAEQRTERREERREEKAERNEERFAERRGKH
jgi:phage-related protein